MQYPCMKENIDENTRLVTLPPVFNGLQFLDKSFDEVKSVIFLPYRQLGNADPFLLHHTN